MRRLLVLFALALALASWALTGCNASKNVLSPTDVEEGVTKGEVVIKKGVAIANLRIDGYENVWAGLADNSYVQVLGPIMKQGLKFEDLKSYPGLADADKIAVGGTHGTFVYSYKNESDGRDMQLRTMGDIQSDGQLWNQWPYRTYVLTAETRIIGVVVNDEGIVAELGPSKVIFWSPQRVPLSWEIRGVSGETFIGGSFVGRQFFAISTDGQQTSVTIGGEQQFGATFFLSGTPLAWCSGDGGVFIATKANKVYFMDLIGNEKVVVDGAAIGSISFGGGKLLAVDRSGSQARIFRPDPVSPSKPWKEVKKLLPPNGEVFRSAALMWRDGVLVILGTNAGKVLGWHAPAW